MSAFQSRQEQMRTLLSQKEDHSNALPVVHAVPESYTSELTLHMTPIKRQTGDLAGRHISLKQPARC